MQVETSCGHTVPLVVALKASTEKTLICEKCFLREKRKKQVQKIVLANGRRFRYLVSARSLTQRIPIRGGA